MLFVSKTVFAPLQTDVKSSEEAGLELHDRNVHLSNHQYHLQAAASTRGYTDRKSRLEQGNRMQRRNQIDNEGRPGQHVPQRKALHQDGHKRQVQDGARSQRLSYDQEIYPLDCRIHHDVGDFKKVDAHNRRRHEQDMLTDRRKSADQNTHLEECTKASEHYGHYERSGHHGRRGRIS